MTDRTLTTDSTPTWDHSYDVVVAGTGAAAFAAAITAADAGLSVVMLESTDRWGGSSAMSGGGLWLPNNPLMRRDKVGDSREEALTYLAETVGEEAGPAASPERREAFVDNVAGFVELAERLGMRFTRAADYPDYYPELPGGKVGRAIECEPFDSRTLGDWWATSRGQDGVPAPMKTDDFWLLQRAWSTPGGFVRGAQVVGRVVGGLVRGKRLVGMGAALAASFLAVAQRLGVTIWLSSPVEELVVEGGRVVGVVTNRDGREVRVEARRGVVLGAGGFDHNRALREQHQGVDGTASSGSKGNVGSGIDAAARVGAALDLMDDAWWGGSIPPADPAGSASFLVSERSVPYSMIVDGNGERFANESESYVDLGHHMLARAKEVPGRFWMIADVRHARRYLRSYMVMDPKAKQKLSAAGLFHEAADLRTLAGLIGVDPSRLAATVDRFNGMARSGIDHDFGRGSSAYDRYYGDPLCRPNPNLGPIEKGPFTAVEIVAGDLGTKGGVVTDTYARALREDGSVIDGLYAAGNCSASVMGRTYPGPGSTLGPATVFGYIAARHLAGRVGKD